MSVEVDANGYERVDSACVNGRTVRVGDILSCSCIYEVARFHARWNTDTKRVVADYPVSVSYTMRFSADCPVHHTENPPEQASGDA